MSRILGFDLICHVGRKTVTALWPHERESIWGIARADEPTDRPIGGDLRSRESRRILGNVD